MAPRQAFSVALPAGLAKRRAGTAAGVDLPPPPACSDQGLVQQMARALYRHASGNSQALQVDAGVDHPRQPLQRAVDARSLQAVRVLLGLIAQRIVLAAEHGGWRQPLQVLAWAGEASDGG